MSIANVASSYSPIASMAALWQTIGQFTPPSISRELSVKRSDEINIHGRTDEAREVLIWIMDNTVSYSIVVDTVINHSSMFGFSVSFLDDTEAVHFKMRWPY
jgi:hypothetical protein